MNYNNVLKAIDKTGSLSKAAKTLNMSYKKAWSLIDAVNKRAKKPVTESSIGGKDGGGAKLTKYGKNLIEVYDNINANCWSFLDDEINNAKL